MTGSRRGRDGIVRVGGAIAAIAALGAGLLPAAPALADDDDDDDDDRETEAIVGSFDGVGADFTGVLDDDEFFVGVADLVNQTAVWTFVDDDDDDDDDDGGDDDDDDDDVDTLENRTTEFVIDFGAPLPDGRFPYRQVIEFTGGTGDFEDASGGATIVGTFDIVTFAYDGEIDGVVTVDD